MRARAISWVGAISIVFLSSLFPINVEASETGENDESRCAKTVADKGPGMNDQGNIGGVDSRDDPEHVKKTYNDWAAEYESDLAAVNYTLPEKMAVIFSTYVRKKDANVFDAGCGTGLSGEELAKKGFTNISGLDFSPEMAELAKTKKDGERPVYREVTVGDLTNLGDTPDDAYEHTIAVGTIGVAPPEAMQELARVTESGGYVIFSNRTNTHLDPEKGFLKQQDELVERGVWEHIHTIKDVVADTKPDSSPFIVYIFRVK